MTLNAVVYLKIKIKVVIIGPNALNELKQIIILLIYITTKKKLISYYLNINDLLSTS